MERMPNKVTNESSDEFNAGMNDAPVAARRYPERVRRNVVIPGAIPWNAVPTGRKLFIL